ncbi:MAG: hypothetical protein U0M15_04575, partial [Bacillota bacterium]|nr:hypothetical protein [Bacillota bacterium]
EYAPNPSTSFPALFSSLWRKKGSHNPFPNMQNHHYTGYFHPRIFICDNSTLEYYTKSYI